MVRMKSWNQLLLFLNEKYGQACITQFSKRIGGEIFGVLANYSRAYDVLKDLFRLSNQRNIPLYVGIGIGTVKDKNINDEHNVNGTAIWNASDAIKRLKDNEQLIKYFRNKEGTFNFFLMPARKYRIC